MALADQAIVSGSSLLTTIIIGRASSKEELGLFAAGLSIMVLAYGAQKALILTPYFVLNPRLQGEDHRRYKGSTILHEFAVSLLLALLLGISGVVLIGSPGEEDLGRLLLILAGSIGFIVFREYGRQISYAELRFRRALILDASVSIVQLSGIILLALQQNLNAALAFAVIGLSCLLGDIGWLISNRRSVRLIMTEARKDLARNWYYGRWLFGSGLLREVSVSLYPWIIIGVHGASEAGMWAAAVGVVALYNPVMLALYNEAAPKISHSFVGGGLAALRKMVSATSRRCSLAALPFFFVLMFFGGDLVTLVYGAKYAGSGLTVGVLAASAFAVAFGFAFPYGLLAIGKPGLDFLGNAAAFLVLLLLGWWAARGYGAVGAAFGVLMAHSVAVLVKATSFWLTVKKEKP